jgi:hypothetical protein
VTAHTTTNWTLGTSGGSGTHNGHATVGAGALNLGVVSSSNINVFANGTAGTGKITSITAVSWDTGIINAANIGTITTTGSSARGDTGDFSQISLLMSNIGNASSTVMTSLTVKGNMAGDDIEWLDGKVNTITVGLSMTNTSVKGDLGSAGNGRPARSTPDRWARSKSAAMPRP